MNLNSTPKEKRVYKVLIYSLFTLVSLLIGWLLINSNTRFNDLIFSEEEQLSNKYSDYLVNHPFRETTKLSKTQRAERGLPPNKFFEQEYLYTSNPNLLRPTPEKLYELQKKLKSTPSMRLSPGDPSNSWVERGPNNVGGRTHELLFAPGSTTKVFAGGVSGGLWINNDITSAASQWQRVESVPGNLSVMSITVDPNNTDIMYLGTGEVYTGGDVIGNGIYKSTDGGDTWIELLTNIGPTVEDSFAYIQDIIAWNNPVTNQTEVYFGAGSTIYREEVVPGPDGWDWHGLNTRGVYKSTDGINFSRLTDPIFTTAEGSPYSPNDFNMDADGNLWMGTRRNAYGHGGGFVFRNDGNNWTNVRNLGTQGRVELACSQQTSGKIYVLAEDRSSSSNPVKIFRTTNGFASAPTSLTQPNDADTNIDPSDFTRGQSFYDLMIAVDPSNDDTVYVGGIDLFKSTNSGNSWNQFSHWYGGFGYQEVHADQHGIAFAPGASNRVIFGNDGGVYYSNNGGSTTEARNNGYNVTQFYKGAINQNISSEILLAGSQDNGSQLALNANEGQNSTTEVTGGDGCWAFIDQDDQYMISSYIYNNYRYITIEGVYVGNFPNSDNTGDFVNQCGLDSDTNILFTNATSGSTYRIYRYAIDPAVPAVTRTTLTNSMLNTIPTFFVASPFVNNRMLVGTALGKIIRLDNANATPTWTDISMPGQVGAVSDIRYGATENDIMVTFHNYGVTSVWYTEDGGNNWVSKEGDLPDMPVKCILQNPLNNDEVIIGTALGVWKTNNWNDTNPNWLQSQNGMQDVKVMSFDFKEADNTILAATYGRGMFTSQFSSCGTITEYVSGSWNNNSPTISGEAIISDNYNTSSSGSIEACSMTIEAGSTLTISAGDYVKVQGDIIVNGSLIVKHEGSLVQVDDNATVTKNGTITIEKTSPSIGNRGFMIVSSPMSSENKNAFGDPIQFRNHITSNFIPNPDVEAAFPGINNFADDNGDNWQQYSGNMNVGEGYLMMPQTTPTIGSPASYNFEFDQGTLTNGEITFNLVYNGTQLTSPNILGNPYASAIDAELFFDENTMINEMYFWEHVTPPTNYPGYNQDNYSMGDISIFSETLGGVQAANGGVTPTQYIASGQGFAVKPSSAGIVTFNNSMRLVDNNDTYRNSEIQRERIWLNIFNESYQLGSTTLIGYTAITTDQFDSEVEVKRLATPVSLYSELETGEQLVIQGRKPFDVEDKVSLSFATQIEESQNYTISIQDIDGAAISEATVYLIDNQNGKITNLSEDDYTFVSDSGVYQNRFTLYYKNSTLDIVDASIESVSVYPNPAQNVINIVSSQVEIKDIAITDIRGRTVLTQPVKSKNEVQLDVSSLTSAIYFMRISTTDGTLTKRIIKK